MKVLMPQLGETVAEGTISAWHKQVGDEVQPDEILLDVETDKVSMEIPSPGRGVLREILVQAGETVEVGTVLAVIAAEGAEDAAESTIPAANAAATAAAGAVAAQAPSGAAASQVEATGAPPAVKPPASGAAEPARAAARNAAEPARATGRSEHQRLSPAVRRLAAENRLDLTAIDGSGRNGRITRRDVVDFIAARPAGGQRSAAAPPSAVGRAPAAAARGPNAAAKPATGAAPDNVVPFTRVRRLTAEHMVRSKATSAHVLQAVEVDFGRVDAVRKAMRDAWRGKHGHSLTYLPFIAKAVCQALTEFPNLNARVEGDGLVLSEQVNLGIAIDLGAEGLLAPVLKGAEQLSVGQLSTAIVELSRRARDHRLKPDDLAGGTYTITNNGSFGTLITAPIINQPQVAILSSDGVRKKPVVIEHPDGDSLAIRPVGILAQSFDHRAVDGAYSAAFLDRVRKLLEQSSWSVDL